MFSTPEQFSTTTKANLETQLNAFNALSAKIYESLELVIDLNINASNGIKQANINVPGKSELKLSNPTIGKLNYVIADDAKVTLSGRGLQLFK